MYMWVHCSWVLPPWGGGGWCACDTYSLETNGSGDGVENGVSVGEVGEASCFDAFEVHGLKGERRIVTMASDLSRHKTVLPPSAL